MHLIRPSEYRRMPWKNGGGETIEIAPGPREASIADFDWRVSMARVAQDGPFSMFNGVDRTLAILDGQGLRLSVGQADPVLLTGSTQPFGFPADVATSAALVGGPVLDFNVMSRRGAFAHRVARLDLAEAQEVCVDGVVTLLFCTRGSVRVTCHEQMIDLEEGDTLHATRPQSLMLVEPHGSATLFLVEIAVA